MAAHDTYYAQRVGKKYVKVVNGKSMRFPGVPLERAPISPVCPIV